VLEVPETPRESTRTHLEVPEASKMPLEVVKAILNCQKSLECVWSL